MADISVTATEFAARAAGTDARAAAPQQQFVERSQGKRDDPLQEMQTKTARQPAADALNLEYGSRSSRIRMDETVNRPVVQILDENKQVVRQYPPEELLKIASRFRQLQGLLFDERR